MPDKVVFLSLEHTVDWPPARWRVLAQAHDYRNRAEDEGYFELPERDLESLKHVAQSLIEDVKKLTGDL